MCIHLSQDDSASVLTVELRTSFLEQAATLPPCLELPLSDALAIRTGCFSCLPFGGEGGALPMTVSLRSVFYVSGHMSWNGSSNMALALSGSHLHNW